MPRRDSAASGWNEPRMAAPTNGPAAMPRNVSAPMTPRARGREPPVNRCDAADVADRDEDAAAGRLHQPRDDQQLQRRRQPRQERADGEQRPARHRNRRRLPHRSASRPASGIVTT